jgi:hypothetical protein
MRSFRGLRYFLAPSWLTGRGEGEKVAFTLEWLLDAFLERLRQGLNSRFPSRAGESALALIGGDRGLLRGRDETRAAWVERLKAWRTPRTHRVRGNAYEALVQVWHYWGGIYAATIDSHGLRHVIDADDSPDVDALADPDTVVSWTDLTDPSASGFAVTCNWDWTNTSIQWSRFWLVLRPTAAQAVGPQPDFGDPALWGGAIGTPGYTLGQTGVTPDDVTAMRALFQELAWNPRHTQPEWLVLGLDPGATPVPDPDGSWKYWSKDSSGTRVAARVTPELVFTFGTFAHRNDAGDLTVDLPDALVGGELLILHEGKSGSAAFSHAAPSGWTVIATRLGSFESARILARIATSSEPTNFAYSVIGSDDHVARVTAVSAPAGGWNTSVAANFADIGVNHGTSPRPNPDNGAEQHRLNFLMTDFFDVAQAAATSGYAELYDSTGEMNLQLSHARVKVTGSTSTFASGNGVVISTRLVYNLGWRFWSLDPTHNNTYGGLRSRPWAMHAPIVDGTDTFAGSRAASDAFDAFPLPGGASYAGTRARFPSRVILLDDGTIPQ